MRIDVNSRYQINSLPELLYGTDAINNSLYNLFRQILGGRALHPDYGSLIPKTLWEPVSPVTAQVLKLSSFKAIERWEPDVIVNTSTSKVIPLSTGDGYQIIIDYTLKETGEYAQANFIFIQ